MKSHPSARVGFTLIELLIVVAIIAILAAIAVPNFLEAQTRSKVARTQSDMRTVSVAIEAYKVDLNKYPPSRDGMGGDIAPRIRRYINLTTPVAYITSVPPDVFNVSSVPGVADRDHRVLVYWGPDYLAANPEWPRALQEFTQITTRTGANTFAFRDPANTWALVSYSPDQDFDVIAEDDGAGGSFPGIVQTYDPTNGTISDGDVIRSRS